MIVILTIFVDFLWKVRKFSSTSMSVGGLEDNPKCEWMCRVMCVHISSFFFLAIAFILSAFSSVMATLQLPVNNLANLANLPPGTKLYLTTNSKNPSGKGKLLLIPQGAILRASNSTGQCTLIHFSVIFSLTLILLSLWFHGKILETHSLYFAFSLGHQSQSSSSGSAQSSSSSSGSSSLPTSLSCTSYILKQTPQVTHTSTLTLSVYVALFKYYSSVRNIYICNRNLLPKSPVLLL